MILQLGAGILERANEFLLLGIRWFSTAQRWRSAVIRWRLLRCLCEVDTALRVIPPEAGVGQGTPESGRGQQQAARAQLPRLARAVGRAIQELARELVPTQPPVADELRQGDITCSRLSNSSLKCPACAWLTNDSGGDQGADAGEPDPVERPHASSWCESPGP